MGNIFVSYTKSDRDWAFWLATELTELCHTPHIHEWEIGGGEDIYAWMETRIDAAHHMLCRVGGVPKGTLLDSDPTRLWNAMLVFGTRRQSNRVSF
jgi:hypothetical protein